MKPPPQLVGTTFHISQGGEVVTLSKEATAITLVLQLGRVAKGEVWLTLPAPPQGVTLDEEPLPETAVRVIERGVWAIGFVLDGSGTLRVHFA